MIGSILAHMVSKRHADYLAEQIKRGGILLWVHVKNKEFEKKAIEIFQKHSGHDVHVHDLPV